MTEIDEKQEDSENLSQHTHSYQHDTVLNTDDNVSPSKRKDSSVGENFLRFNHLLWPGQLPPQPCQFFLCLTFSLIFTQGLHRHTMVINRPCPMSSSSSKRPNTSDRRHGTTWRRCFCCGSAACCWACFTSTNHRAANIATACPSTWR